MGIDGFATLFAGADARGEPARVAVAGGDDQHRARGAEHRPRRGAGSEPVLVGPESRIRSVAAAAQIDLQGFVIHDASGPEIAARAVAAVRSGEAQALMKGQIPTPELMKAVLDSASGLAHRPRHLPGRPDGDSPRRPQISSWPIRASAFNPDSTTGSTFWEARSSSRGCWARRKPKVALMAATETVKPSMPETVEWAELTRRGRLGEFADCVVEGPLSFDLAYASDAGVKKHVESEVGGAADVMLFPNLLSANLTVKAIMYTADCRFGGVLRGTSAPVVFMSRADSTETRLHSLALTLRILDHEGSQARLPGD